MSSVQERLQLKRVPLDTWNIREQLCLASAVVRSGDQNWMSVSRALKTIGEANRPPDWYSQKSCAAQYGALLEHVETPKRKKRSSEGAVETPQESILKRLTQERMVEIQKTITELNQQYEQLRNEINEARSSSTSEDRLREMWTEIEAAKRARERETARRAQWLKEREERRARAERTWRPPANSTPTVAAPVATPSSPLLTSLLKSSPVVTTPQHIPHPANVVETVSPSAGAPTLSMLLEKGGSGVGGGGASPHDNKHAAIEHIKSQLMSIEQQVKANTPPPVPLPTVAPVPAVDIDDIEIKAEDVYAFRDIDIHIPPVTHMHKPNRPAPDRPIYRSSEPEIAPAVDNTVVQQNILAEQIKEEPIAMDTTGSEEIVPVDVQTATTTESTRSPPVDQKSDNSGVHIAFPAVKFPTTEIKVIQSTDLEVKEEIKEPEPTPIEVPVQHEVVDEINVQDVSVEQQSTIQEPTEEAPAVPEYEVPIVPSQPPELVNLQPSEVTPTEDIPLPPGPNPADVSVENTETPAPQEVPQEMSEQLKEEPRTGQSDLQEERQGDHIKIEAQDPDDSILEMHEMAHREGVDAVLEDNREEIKQEIPQEAELEETHTETDDDTPMELSREEEKDGKKKKDYSRKRKPDSRPCSGSESAAEASAPDSPSTSDADRQHRLWKKSVMLVYSRLCAHKYASLFLRPITDEEAPGYSIVVKRPMDLTAIRRNIDNGIVRTTAEFQRDVLLMLSNALMYNSSEHSVYTMAKEMFDEAACQLGMLLAAQAHAGLGTVQPTPPARRKRRKDSPTPLQLTPKRVVH